MGDTDTTTSSKAAAVRKLLDRAQGTDNEHERDACVAKAFQLMATYQIDEAMLAQAQPATADKLIRKRVQLGSGFYVGARVHLAFGVATGTGCKGVTYGGHLGRTISFEGFASDVERAELLYTSLLAQATRAASEVRGGTDQLGRRIDTRSARRDFMLGFADEVRHRLHVARMDARRAAEGQRGEGGSQAGTSSVALALVDRAQQVGDWFDQRHGKLGTYSTGSPLGSGEYSAGQAAGERADLGGARMGGSSTKALGR